MRMLLNIRIPHEPFNSLVRAGTAGTTIRAIWRTPRPKPSISRSSMAPEGGAHHRGRAPQ